MDWSKAKVVLIFIFLALNIFLVYNVMLQESKVTVISKKDIADIKSILKTNNVELNTKLPRKIKPKSFLKVEDIDFDKKMLINNFLGNNTKDIVANKLSNNTMVYSRDTKSLEIHSNNKIVYNNGRPSENIKQFNKNEALKYAEKFLREKRFYPQYAVLDKVESIKEGYQITYKQEFEGYRIYSSYMNLKISKEGIIKLERFWVNPVNFVDTPKNIKTPLEVLLAFVKDINNKNKVTIDKVQLGYLLPKKDFTNATVSAVPAWRIETSEGNVYYYNAYEGYMENEEDKG